MTVYPDAGQRHPGQRGHRREQVPALGAERDDQRPAGAVTTCRPPGPAPVQPAGARATTERIPATRHQGRRAAPSGSEHRDSHRGRPPRPPPPRAAPFAASWPAAARAGILLSLPAVVVVVALLGMPIGQAVYYSMTNWNGITATWIGPSTYSTALTDPIFWRVHREQWPAAAGIPFAIGIPLGIAALLNEHVRGWRFFRSVYFLPTAVSWVVIGMVALQFFALNGIAEPLPRPTSAWARSRPTPWPARAPRCSPWPSRSSGPCWAPTRSSS